MARQAMNALGALGVIMVVILGSAHCRESAAQTATRSAPGAGNPLAATPLAELKATRERPLFSPTRRPPRAAVVAAAPAPPSPLAVAAEAPEAPPFTLLGTLIGPSDRIAILMNESTKQTTRLREGARDSGWTLRSVDPRSAVMANEGRLVGLELPKSNGVTGAPAKEVAGADVLASDVAGRRGVAVDPASSRSSAAEPRRVTR
jgi:general secretion pathway protein N